jgi:biotin carboxyl carrier protein
VTGRGRLRVSVTGAAPLVVQLEPSQIEELAPPSSAELVSAVPASAHDAAQGRRRLEVIVDGWRFEVVVESAAHADLRERALRAAGQQQATLKIRLRAQIPGRVVRLWASAGEHVEQGQRLLAIEAMKMENEIKAPHAGVVEDIRVGLGDLVERGDELVSIG